MEKTLCAGVALLMLTAPAVTAQAAVVSIDCTKKGTIGLALAKLDRSLTNTINVTGTCTENVVIDGHRDLTIAAQGAATLSPADPDLGTVWIIGSSRVRLTGLTVNSGFAGVQCDDRSVCLLRGVTIVGGIGGGLVLQKQSSADVIGGSIVNSSGNGIGVFGASSVNVSPGENGSSAVISGHVGNGILVQDASFLRTDDATVTGNTIGVSADRGAVIKLLGEQSNVSNNSGDGVSVRASTAQVTGSVKNNGGRGIRVLQLGYLAITGNTDLSGNGGDSVNCTNVTSVTNPRILTGQSFVILDPVPRTNCPNTNP